MTHRRNGSAQIRARRCIFRKPGVFGSWEIEGMNVHRIGASKLAAATFAVAALLVLAAGPAAAQSTLERAREDGYISVGFANESPFGYATTSGELTGEAPAIAKIILERMSMPESDGVLTEFGSLIPGLRAGRFDIIAAKSEEHTSELQSLMR